VSVLSANGIRKAFRRHQVLTGVDLDISAGQLARYIGMSVRGGGSVGPSAVRRRASPR
jgi:ABC-type polar amino acid transport system ATPase subunit